MLTLGKRKLFKILEISSIFVGVIMALYYFYPVFAAPPTTPYAPGETTDPACTPGSTNCTVYPPLTTTLTTSTAITMATSALRFAYDSTNYTALTVAADGALTVSSTGGVTTTFANKISVLANSYFSTISSGTWNGSVIGVAYGGTNSSTIGPAGSVAYSNASSYLFTAAGTVGQILQANGTDAPTWINTSTMGFVNLQGVTSGTQQTGNFNISGTGLIGAALGINTTSPIASLSVQGTGTKNPFTIVSSTNGSMLTVLTNGNVGIGTSTPSEKLQVVGNISNVIDSNTTFSSSIATVGTSPYDIFVSGRYAYVTNYGGGTLSIVDVTDPLRPSEISTVSVGTSPYSVYVSGHYAYTANYNAGTISVVDVSNHAVPKIAATFSISKPAGIYVSGRYAYVTNFDSSTISVVDVSNPLSLAFVASTTAGTNPLQIYVQGNYAYVANRGSSYISIIDISNPSAPRNVANPVVGISPHDIHVSGRYAYVSVLENDNFAVVDISNPNVPVVVTSTPASSGLGGYALYVSGRYAYVTRSASSTLAVIDISNSSTPVLAATIPVSPGPGGVYVSGRYAYVTNYSGSSITVIDISGTEVTSLIAHSAEVGNLQSRNDIFAEGNIMAGTSLSVGAGGIMSQGALSVFASSTDATSSIFNVSSAQTSNIFNVFANGKIGIGSSTPSTLLVVNGTSTMNGLQILNRGSAAVPALAIGTATDGIYQRTATTLNITTNGAITAEFYNGSISTNDLKVSAIYNGSTAGSSGGGVIDLTTVGLTLGIDGNAAILNIKNNVVGINTTTINSTLTVQGTDSINPFSILSSTTASLLTVLTNGNIGVNSSSPIATLAVQGNYGTNPFSINSSTGATMLNVQTNGTVNVGMGALSIRHNNAVTNNAVFTAGSSGSGYFNVCNDGWCTGFGGDAPVAVTTGFQLYGAAPIIFEGSTDNSFETRLNVVEPTADRTVLLQNLSGTVVITELTTNNVGLGTTTPQAKLTIQSTSSNPFSIVTSTAGAESMFIVLTNGNVGIGSSTPSYNFVSTGTAALANLPSGALSDILVCWTTDGQLTRQATNCTVSSARFKENIQSLSSDKLMEKVQKLRVVSFDYKSNGQPSEGFIAEEIALIDPMLVVYTDSYTPEDLAFEQANYPSSTLYKDGKILIPQTVDYSRISVLLTGALQDIDARLTAYVASAELMSSVFSIDVADISNDMPNFATVILDKFTLAVKNSLRKLGLLIKDGVAMVKELVADKVKTNQLCVGQTCINEQQLQDILSKTQTQATPVPVIPSEVVADEGFLSTTTQDSNVPDTTPATVSEETLSSTLPTVPDESADIVTSTP